MNQVTISLDRGIRVIGQFAKSLGEGPGVYRMLSEAGEILYVGKARNLHRRVASYTQPQRLPNRLQRMISETTQMEVTDTHTEAEALLLESNLIKKHGPRFNVLLRDDKSYPYILIQGDHDYPAMWKHRGGRQRKGDYYGPFASAGAVNHTITALQKAFQLRNCTDFVFANRTRPCLQYHIKRCTAPCVGYVDAEKYEDQVRAAKDFLSGKSRQVFDRFAQEMQEASDKLDFETAARMRDRIRALSSIYSHQDVNVSGVSDADIFAIIEEGGQACVQVFFYRGGQNYGNRAFFPSLGRDENADTILSSFIAQFYEDKPVPREILLSKPLPEQSVLEEALNLRMRTKKKQARLRIYSPQRGARRRLVDMALSNARQAMQRKHAEQEQGADLMELLAELFEMDKSPERIEVYDNSHISGQDMMGVMIVAGPEGFLKNQYRKFSIREANAGDDYGMMREVMSRRFSRALKSGEDKRFQEKWPDLLLIDGGKGQVQATLDAFEKLGIGPEDVAVVGVAKGPDRHAGRETFYPAGRAPFQLPPDSPVLRYIQRLRDEAHRFAVGAHRTRRHAATTRSPLDEIPGIGPKRKKALLKAFGSGKQVARAGLKDLEQVEGISRTMARQIYTHFHGEAHG